MFSIILLASSAVLLVEGSDLNTEFLPHQCWVPRSQDPDELMMGDAPTHFDLNAFIPDRLDLPSSNVDLDFDDDWYPPPPPPNVTEVIANNDLRAYYYYLSDPDLQIEIQEECAATNYSLEANVFVSRHKYVFVDSQGNRIEVVVEEVRDFLLPRKASDRKHKSSRNLMLSLVGGGGVRSKVVGRKY